MLWTVNPAAKVRILNVAEQRTVSQFILMNTHADPSVFYSVIVSSSCVQHTLKMLCPPDDTEKV